MIKKQNKKRNKGLDWRLISGVLFIIVLLLTSVVFLLMNNNKQEQTKRGFCDSICISKNSQPFYDNKLNLCMCSNQEGKLTFLGQINKLEQ